MKQKIIAITSIALTAPFTSIGKINARETIQSKPNVVFIIADDLGYGDLSCYGQKKFQTPHVDRLALNGIRFTQCYSGTTVSAPSRCSLVTGLHTGHASIRGNKEIQPEGQQPLPTGSTTIFNIFKNAGYVTGAFGKWGLGFPGSEGEPNKQGVDEFFGYNCQRQAHKYYPQHLWHNEQKVELPHNENWNKGTYAQDLIQEKALQFIEANQKNPFFMFVPCVLPHAELVVPEDSIIQKFRGLYPETPYKGDDNGPGYGSQPQPHAAFAAMVYRFNIYVGQIVEKLKELGVYENTLIIVTSDNGPHMEGGADPDFFNSNSIYRGYKRDLYEGGIRVPMIASWQNQIPKGKQSELICTFWDMMPTFAEITGSNVKTTDGLSILPTLTGKGEQKLHEHIYFEFLELNGKQAVRKGDWKLLYQDIRKNGYYELYNLAADPSENHNVISLYPEIANELKTIMKQEHIDDPMWPLK